MMRSPQMVEMIASRAAAKVAQISQQWRLPQEVGRDLARLGLYDIILYIGEIFNSSDEYAQS